MAVRKSLDYHYIPRRSKFFNNDLVIINSKNGVQRKRFLTYQKDIDVSGVVLTP